MKKAIGFILLCSLSHPAYSEEFSFDLSAYQKKPYEFFGHFDLMATQFTVDPDAAFSHLNFPGQTARDFPRYYSELELGGIYRFEQATFNFRALSYYQQDQYAGTSPLTEHTLQELYFHVPGDNNWQFDIGKKAVKWGKGYAWNPVGFIEKAKNPDDPELNREGYSMISGDWTLSRYNTLQNLNAGLYILPISQHLNTDLIPNCIFRRI